MPRYARSKDVSRLRPAEIKLLEVLETGVSIRKAAEIIGMRYRSCTTHMEHVREKLFVTLTVEAVAAWRKMKAAAA